MDWVDGVCLAIVLAVIVYYVWTAKDDTFQ